MEQPWTATRRCRRGRFLAGRSRWLPGGAAGASSGWHGGQSPYAGGPDGPAARTTLSTIGSHYARPPSRPPRTARSRSAASAATADPLLSGMESRQEWTSVLAVKQGIGDHGRPLQAPERPADDDGRTILMTQKPGRRWEARSQDKRPSMAVRGPLAGSADARGGRPSILGSGRRAIAVGRPLSANRGPGCPRGRPNPRNEGSGRPSGALWRGSEEWPRRRRPQRPRRRVRRRRTGRGALRS